MNSDFLFELQGTFLTEASEMLGELEGLFLKLEENPSDVSLLNAIFRLVHTLKGSSQSVNFADLGHFAHSLETLLSQVKSRTLESGPKVIDVMLAAMDSMRTWVECLKDDRSFHLDVAELISCMQALSRQDWTLQAEPSVDPSLLPQAWGVFDDDDKTKTVHSPQKNLERPDESIRLPMSRIDALLNLFGEQVILQASLEQARRAMPDNHEATDAIVNQLGKITYDLQHTVMSLRMISLSGLFHKMQRTVRDTAKSLGKSVEIDSFGEDMELDKVVVDQLSGAVTHLIRNAIDHGIEDQATRASSGKNPVARITIRASQESGRFSLEITDDGRGLDRDKILAKALQQGIIESPESLTDPQIYQLIFKSGFSTADRVSDVSGRGVGMDAVKSIVDGLRGEIVLDTRRHEGTKIAIRLPLNMSIFNGMIFRLWQDRYILPSREIKEIICYDRECLHSFDGSSGVLQWQDRILTLVDMDRFLYRRPRPRTRSGERRIALVVHRNNREYALEVDEVIGQQRVVLKKLGRELENFPNVSGGAILGDGQVAMILSLDDIGV